MALRPACRSCRRDEARIRIAAIRARRSTVTVTLLTPRLSLLLAHDSSRKAANGQKATRQRRRRYYSINWNIRRIRVERGGVRSAEKAQWLEPELCTIFHHHHHPPPPSLQLCTAYISGPLHRRRRFRVFDCHPATPCKIVRDRDRDQQQAQRPESMFH